MAVMLLLLSMVFYASYNLLGAVKGEFLRLPRRA